MSRVRDNPVDPSIHPSIRFDSYRILERYSTPKTPMTLTPLHHEDFVFRTTILLQEIPVFRMVLAEVIFDQ